MPPTLTLEVCKTYIITFKEKYPRVVKGGYSRPTPVLNVEYKGEPYSLYLSNVDLARRVHLIEEEIKKDDKTLLDAKFKIHNKVKKGKRNYIYEVELIQ